MVVTGCVVCSDVTRWMCGYDNMRPVFASWAHWLTCSCQLMQPVKFSQSILISVSLTSPPSHISSFVVASVTGHLHKCSDISLEAVNTRQFNLASSGVMRSLVVTNAGEYQASHWDWLAASMVVRICHNLTGGFSAYSRLRWQWEHLWHFTPPTVNLWQRSSLEQSLRWAILIGCVGWQWHYWVIFQDGTKAVVNKIDGREGESSKYFLQNVISGFVSKSALNERLARGAGDHPCSCVTLSASWINTGNSWRCDL